jgi:hypothetical protein
LPQVREVVRATAQRAKSQRLAAVPVLTVELPAAFSPELVAAVDAVGAVIQPFFTGAVDTSQKRCDGSAICMLLCCSIALDSTSTAVYKLCFLQLSTSM